MDIPRRKRRLAQNERPKTSTIHKTCGCRSRADIPKYHRRRIEERINTPQRRGVFSW
nr:MAG TPA: hypothetical protein [Caudoviricetes sp.]